MGLAVTVGMLYGMRRNDVEGFRHYQAVFTELEEALAGKGVNWREPRPADTEPPGLPFGQIPYSYLHHLRRALVLHRQGTPVTPARTTSSEQYERDQKEVEEESYMLASHLLCHSDHAGYYVPVDFRDLLMLDDKIAGGGLVGSSQRLLAELRECAPAIGVEPGQDPTAVSPDDPYEPEKHTWHQLYRACRSSISTGHAIVFH